MTPATTGRAKPDRGLLWTVLGAIVVAAVVLTLLGRPDVADPLPDLPFAELDGTPFVAKSLRGTVWVAYIEADPPSVTTVTPSTLTHDDPDRLTVVFAVERPGRTPSRGRTGMRTVIGDAEAIAGLREQLGFSGTDAALAIVDHTNRPIRVQRATEVDSTSLAEELARHDGLSRRPALHAILNGICAGLLLCGLWLVRRRQIVLHVVCMLSATIVSGGFLVSYLHYHSIAGAVGFPGSGWPRAIYLVILLSHTILAALVAPLVLTVLYRAARRQFARHRAVARWTLPIWLYVSITGVVIYVLLYKVPWE